MRQFAPRYSVTLFRVSSGNSSEVDLTPFLGDGGSIRTGKDIRQPAGVFSLTFVDKRHQALADSVYQMAAPMDCIEIRCAHDGSKEPTLLMRGFISSIHRAKAMTADGKPSRRVTITGHDFGKLMMTQQIHLLPNAEEQALVLSGYGVLAKYFGDAYKTFQANDFVALFAGILHRHAKIITASHERLNTLSVISESDIEGSIPCSLVNPLTEMSYYQFLGYLLDVGPFNELFIEDMEEGARLVARPNFSGGEGIAITEDDVVAVDVSRSDARVANWYWVLLRGSMMIDQTSALLQAVRGNQQIVDARADARCSEEKYGWRKMQVDAHLHPPRFSNSDAKTERMYRADQSAYIEWLDSRTQLLREANIDNAHLEDATFRICGNESAKPGTYLTFNEGSTSSRYYIVRVDHEMPVFGNFITVLTCERGSGYVPAAGNGRYAAELNLRGALNGGHK